MGKVARALMWHELLERTRDRWVLVISVLFALLASGVSLYGRNAENASGLIGPSLVTLSGLFVPLVALILGHDAIVGEKERNTLGLLLSLPLNKGELVTGKFLGRFFALTGAILIGIGAPILFAGRTEAATLLRLLTHTLLLGAAFLSIGILLSTLVRSQVTAASMGVSTWFLFVFFYDLGLLGLLVITDGGLSQTAVAHLVQANPAGLFRIEMMAYFAGEEVLANLGVAVGLPGLTSSALIWACWIILPVSASIFILIRRRVI